MYAFLGNHAAKDPGTAGYRDAAGQPVLLDLGEGGELPEGYTYTDGDPVEGKQRTEVVGPDDATVLSLFHDITSPGGIWAHHAVGGSKPAWVASDNPELAQLLGSAYECEIREPLPYGEQEEHAQRPLMQSLIGTTLAVALLLPVVLLIARLDLRTSAGIDWQSDLMGSAAGVPAKYMALSATSGESAAHTSLAGEIATGGGGLIRKAATYAHTTSTTTYTQTATFTANGSDSLPVTVKQCALLTASSSGVLAFEKIITDTLFAASGDAATVTYTVTP